VFSFLPSLVITAAGAILIWGVNATTHGVNIHTVGWILFIVGIIAFLLQLFFTVDWADKQPPRSGPPA
jgi:hypothetical protein